MIAPSSGARIPGGTSGGSLVGFGVSVAVSFPGVLEGAEVGVTVLIDGVRVAVAVCVGGGETTTSGEEQAATVSSTANRKYAFSLKPMILFSLMLLCRID